MSNHTFAIPGSNERQPTVESFVERSSQEAVQQQIDYINQIYAEQDQNRESAQSAHQIEVASNNYRQEAINEALSTVEARNLTPVEIIAQSSEAEMFRYASEISKTLNYYTDKFVSESNGQTGLGESNQSADTRSDYARAA